MKQYNELEIENITDYSLLIRLQLMYEKYIALIEHALNYNHNSSHLKF